MLENQSLLFVQGHVTRHFGPFGTRVYTVSKVFLGYKSSKNDKNMIACPRLYVKPTETRVLNSSKRSLISHLKQLREKIRGHNLSLIIITSKGSKESRKKTEK